ncbi:MAG: hypothetical protein ACOY4R_05585 [Pseudomonadota bacterium]
MQVGVQYTGAIGPSETRRFFSHSWSPTLHVIWTVVPQTVLPGAPQLEWQVSVERASAAAATYWITIKNLTTTRTDFELRYAIVN